MKMFIKSVDNIIVVQFLFLQYVMIISTVAMVAHSNNQNNDNINALKSHVMSTTNPSIPIVYTSTQTYRWNKEEFPNPQQNPQFCNRQTSSLLCDPDKFLTKQDANRLDFLMGQTTNTTKCYCNECLSETSYGISVAIAITTDIYQDYNVRAESAAQEFANHLRHRWQFGTCDNTVLILLVASKPEITISLGTVAEKILSNDFFNSTIYSHWADFETGQFFQGLSAIIGGIRIVAHSSKKAPIDLGDEPGPVSSGISNQAQHSSSTALIVVGIIVGFLLLVMVLTGTIFIAKKKYEKDDNESAIGPNQKPSGYWSNGDGEVKTTQANDETKAEEEEEEEEENEDEDEAPPVPKTLPPQITSSGTTRKLSGPNGGMEYEPVSIEEDDQPRSTLNPTASNTIQRPSLLKAQQDSEDSHLHGKDEILDQSSRISTPEMERHSKL